MKIPIKYLIFQNYEVSLFFLFEDKFELTPYPAADFIYSQLFYVFYLLTPKLFLQRSKKYELIAYTKG